MRSLHMHSPWALSLTPHFSEATNYLQSNQFSDYNHIDGLIEKVRIFQCLFSFNVYFFTIRVFFAIDLYINATHYYHFLT